MASEKEGKIRVSQELHDFFSRIGKKGGKRGGRNAALAKTAEQRAARARKAALARWAKLR